MKFEIAEDGKSIKCLACGLTSYHPEDVRNRYCGKCHVFHEDRFKGVTTTKPPPNAHLFRPMTGEAAGIEPLFSNTYLRRVRVEGEE